MTSHAKRVAIVLLTLGLTVDCTHPPADSNPNSDSQKLPFDRQPRAEGVSPSQSLIPSSTKLPEGTPIPIRLQGPLSSASSHAGDSFNATVDEAVAIDGQTLLAGGTTVIGRVLEAKPASSRGGGRGSALEPGYLRIVLVSLNVGGKTVVIETSSIFAKGGSREERSTLPGKASAVTPKNGVTPKNKDIVFGVDHRLNFRLTQAVDLH